MGSHYSYQEKVCPGSLVALVAQRVIDYFKTN